MAALVRCEEELEQGEDFFMWPCTRNPHEALFVVDDAAERAAWDGISQSHGGVQTTLSKMDDALAHRGRPTRCAEAQQRMADEVVAWS